MNIPTWLELLFVLFLIILNGFFAASEIAIISVRKSLIKQLIAKNDKKASILMELHNNPDTLLATIQIGITIISTLASAFAGATIIEALSSLIIQIPIPAIQAIAHSISFIIVVAGISYLSLIVGELVPKTLALQHAEKFSLWCAPIIYYFSKVAHPFVTLLTFSKNGVLRIFGQKTTYHTPSISEEEIKMMVKEGREKGVFDQTEQEIIQKAFSFTDTTAKETMTPRFKVHALDVSADKDEVLKMLGESGFARFPVFEEEMDNIIGVLHNKDVIHSIADKKKIDLRKLIIKPLFVPEAITLSRLLKKLQKERQSMAIVINEYGSMEGLITVEDILEELVGEIRDETDDHEMSEVKKVKENIFLIDGAKNIKDINETLMLNLPEEEEFETIAGFILSHLQTAPEKGKSVVFNNMKFSIEKVEENRIAEVKIELLPEDTKKKK